MEWSVEDKEKDEELLVANNGYKVVPWISWEEWIFVFKSLFSSSPHSVAAALTRISAWRSRGPDVVPIPIQVTASIIQIHHQDPFFREGLDFNATNSEEVLSMLYSMAIMRLVNGVVEKSRKKEGTSIAVEADRIGLPRMLIDIRHEASHRDLPSLQLVRLASMEALTWLKSYYWEPQKNVIPFQRERITNIGKQIERKLRKLAFYLNLKQASQSGSSPMKRKRPKGQIKRTLRILVRLYSSFPSEVMAVLADLLLKFLESSDGNDVKSSYTSGVQDISGNLKTLAGTTNIWKLILIRLSSKQPELILTMLKELLERINSRKATKSENGKEHLSWSEYMAKTRQIEQLSSLVLWLIEKYKRVKRPSQIVCGDETQQLSDKINVTEATLMQLLKKCLLVFSPGNGHLVKSAVLLAQMVGNSSMVERIKKLSELSFTNSDSIEESSTLTDTDYFLEQETSLTRAREMLDLLKRSLWDKGKAASIGVSDGELGKESRWRVAKSWKPCPIGMLPGAFHSSGVIPILDRALNLPEVQQASENSEVCGLTCNGKRDASFNGELLEHLNPTKKSKMSVEDCLANEQYSFEGQLLVDGVLKKVGEEEQLSIESAIRVLV